MVGVDGADWRVIERLWARGELPHLRALAEDGVSAELGTAFGKSPVIWTTIATGLAPVEHGITDFVVATDHGDVPVGATLRRAPALWNMASSEGLRVAVFGWWASWPAEEVNGVLVSDLALEQDRDRRAHPESLDGRLDAAIERARGDDRLDFPRDEVGARDRLMASLAIDALHQGDDDLTLVYFRGLDIASHFGWKYHQPERFDLDPALAAEHGDPVADAYRAFDVALGRLVEAAGPEVDVMVVSDHGFHALREEETVVQLALDPLLEQLGFLHRDPEGRVDIARSALYSFASRPTSTRRLLRFGGRAESSGERSAVLAALESELDELSWSSGEPVFRVAELRAAERREGADLVLAVLRGQAESPLRYQGHALEAPRAVITRISGSHGPRTSGIFLARGPHVDREAALEQIRIHDLAPTVLYALGLPVGRDFVGVARTQIFDDRFRRLHPLTEVDSWGRREPVLPEVSARDEHQLEELRALGYVE